MHYFNIKHAYGFNIKHVYGRFAKRRYELFNLKMHMGVLQTAGTAFFLKKTPPTTYIS